MEAYVVVRWWNAPTRPHGLVLLNILFTFVGLGGYENFRMWDMGLTGGYTAPVAAWLCFLTFQDVKTTPPPHPGVTDLLYQPSSSR